MCLYVLGMASQSLLAVKYWHVDKLKRKMEYHMKFDPIRGFEITKLFARPK